tara:strand:- start:1397 stop:2059 length:663 start_codon:yes stop_codon:yes gene_type:complete
MKAFILAAGRGERLRPLTENTPKPLIKIRSKPLIEYHLERLAQDGFREVVINLHYLGEHIRSHIGDGNKWNLSVQYSTEPEGLEAAGGIVQALPLLGNKPFLMISADIWSDFPFGSLLNHNTETAHCITVDNPDHHPSGDFFLNDGHIRKAGAQKERVTYANIGVFHPKLFIHYEKGVRSLGSVLSETLDTQCITGKHYKGIWRNVTTPEDVIKLNTSTY